MLSEVAIVEVKAQPVLGMRKTGPYAEIANMLPKVFEFALGRNIPIAGPPVFVCHEITVEEAEKADREGNADVEVAVPILEKVDTGSEEITCYELPGGKMAKTIYKGPYEECTPTYEKLFSWLAENGKTIVGPIREAYLNDPQEVPPDEILTEIYVPID